MPGISCFLDRIANEAWKRFADRPDHPFYHLGSEIPWRRLVATKGEGIALTCYSLMVTEANYADSDRNEEQEIQRRRALARGDETSETEGLKWGQPIIKEGEEEIFVKAKLNVFYSRWKSVKKLMNPEEEKDDFETFKSCQKDIYLSACHAIHGELGWRWKKSPTLVAYLEMVVDGLAEAEEATYGGENVLDWSDRYDEAEYVGSVSRVYGCEWLREHRDSLAWFTRFRNIRLRSTQMAVEVEDLVNDCNLADGKRDQHQYEALMETLMGMSPSAIHRPQVQEYITNERPDLLTDEHLSMSKVIPGIFYQIEEPGPWDLFVKTPSRLSPHQCELLKARHLIGMIDPATPFATRVRHAQAFVSIPTTNVKDVAEALSTPSLPSRIVEAILMYLPTMGEPSSTLQLLLAPVYLYSHLARTSIHAVENALKYVSLEIWPDYILPLFPPVGKRQSKVMIQKEGVRLACANMSLIRDSRISNMIKDLWVRKDLSSDVRVVILQSLLGLLAGPDGKEVQYQDTVEWIWSYLSEISHSSEYKKAGVATVLLAVTPSGKYMADAPRVLFNVARANIQSATLADLAVINIPNGLVDRYVDEVLYPLCAVVEGEDADDVDLVQLRTVALQVMIGSENWFTPKNAVKIAKDWRQQAAQISLEDDTHQLWMLLTHGISRCVGKEAQGALENGGDGIQSWNELAGVVQDMAEKFLDRSLRRALRQRAMEDRIRLLNLGGNGTLSNFEKAQAAGAFSGQQSDIVKPLMTKTLEPVTWNIVLSREIKTFNPQDSMTEEQINEQAFKILVRIAEFSNKYLADFNEVQSWVQHSLLGKTASLFVFLGRAILEPREELLDWVHLDDLGLMILKQSNGRLPLTEIGAFVERLASQDPSAFYWTHAGDIAQRLFMEVVLGKNKMSDAFYTKESLESTSALLTPIMKRAQEARWTHGPDSIIAATVLPADMQTMMKLFPKDVGPMVHQRLVEHASRGESFTSHFESIVELGNTAIREGATPSHDTKLLASSRKGMTPSAVFIIESLINGQLDKLDFAAYCVRQDLPLDVLEGLWYESPSKVGSEPIRTLKAVDDRWIENVRRYSGYFGPLAQGMHFNI